MKFFLLLAFVTITALFTACSSEQPLPEGVEGDMIGRWYSDSTNCSSYNDSALYLIVHNGLYLQFNANHSLVTYNPILPQYLQSDPAQWELLANDSNFVISGVNSRTGLNFSDTFVIKHLNATNFSYKQINKPVIDSSRFCYGVEKFLYR